MINELSKSSLLADDLRAAMLVILRICEFLEIDLEAAAHGADSPSVAIINAIKRRRIKGSYAAPIVAAVPSEPIQVYLVATKKGYMIEGSVPSNTSLKLGFNTLYAAPISTAAEQASDVRNDALEEAAKRCDDKFRLRMSGGFPREGSTARVLAEEIRALKSSFPAAKDNAPVEVAEQASDDQIEAVRDAVAGALGDAYDCTRCWSAWSYGTMTQDDFSEVREDGERVAEIAGAAIDAMLMATTSAAKGNATEEKKGEKS